uniref:RNA-directed DNA polymerase n=1 Tax=Trichuris muris TaxID=70415 RepID=A0A5S6QMF2_TRIMR
MSNDPKRPDSRTTGKRPESKTTSSQFFKLTTVDAVGRASTTALIGPLGENSGAVSSDIVLLNVDGIVGGERQSILIDSGSAVTLVHKEAYRRWSEPPHLAATECSILAANGSSIPTIGVCRVQFCFGTKTVCHPAYIVEGVPLSCVIGADFLMQHGCVVDAKRQTLTVGEVSVPMRCNLTSPRVPTSDGSWGSPAFYSVLVDSSLPRPAQCNDYVQKNSISIVNHLVKLRSWLPNVDAQEMLQAQRSDPEIGTVLEWTEKESWPEQSPTGANRALRYLWCQKGQFSIRGRLLYRRWVPVLPPGRGVTTWLLVIPKSLIPRLLESAHDGPAGGHLGGKKTFEKLRRSFYWPNQREDVANWCESCEACARRKSGGSKRPRAPLQQQCIGNPWERICLDFLGPFTETTAGNRYLLIVTDSFTKWTEAFPVRDMEGATTASVLVHEWFCRYGLPEEILSDQGRTFESELMKSVCVLLDVRKLRTSAYHAQGNGQVERFNRTLLGMLSVTAREQPFDWDEQVPLHLLAYRTSVHSSTGITPFQAVFGREAKLPADIMYGPPPEQADQMNMHVYASKLRGNLEAAYARARKYIGQAQKRQKELFDKRVNFKPLCAGELVWLLDPSRITGKLYQPWTGPFKVVEVVGMVNYKIQRVDRPSLTMVVHYDRLKRSHQRQPHLNEPRNSPELERSVLNRPQRHRRRPATLEGFVDIA